MVATSSFLATCSLFALSFATPIGKTAADSVVARGAYVMFGGDGTVAKGWPSRKSWLSFRNAWEANLETIQNSCQVEGWGENNSDAETQAIKDSISKESGASGIPKEFILAIMMQESKGCVRAPTTAWGHANPGLMQSAEGKGSCNPDGNPISPCPATEIRQMIHDGTNGDGLETTLTQCVADAGATDDSKWYKAARLYNAGKITDDNLGIGPTPCYASDIANRLTSPFNWSVCDNAVIGSLSSARTAAEVSFTPDEPSSAPTPTTPAPASTSKASVDAETPKVPDTKPANIIDGAAAGCTEYFVPKSGDTCASAPVDLSTLLKLNPQLNPECTNLWADYGYCVAA